MTPAHPAPAHSTPPLRGLNASSPGAENLRDRPLRPIPRNELAQNAPDPVVQTSVGPLVATNAGLNFAGVGNGDYGVTVRWAPPGPW